MKKFIETVSIAIIYLGAIVLSLITISLGIALVFLPYYGIFYLLNKLIDKI